MSEPTEPKNITDDESWNRDFDKDAEMRREGQPMMDPTDGESEPISLENRIMEAMESIPKIKVLLSEITALLDRVKPENLKDNSNWADISSLKDQLEERRDALKDIVS